MEEKKSGHKVEHHVPKEIKIKADYFKIASFALLVLLVLSLFTSGFRFEKTMSKDKAAEKAITFINDEVLPAGTVAKVDSVEKQKDLYLVKITVGTSQYDTYVTKDARLLFLNGIPMDASPTTATDSETVVSCEDVPKTAKPKVELFVMSMCPWGSVAIKTLAPVFDVLKNVVDFNVHMIASENKDGTFSSLHNDPEVKEDIRQVCAMNKYPKTYMKYLQCIANDYSNSALIWQDCVKKSGMELNIIKTCSESEEGKTLLRENIKRTNELKIGASPTFLVNGMKYKGGFVPEDYKKFICCGSAAEIAECSETLSTASATQAAGNC